MDEEFKEESIDLMERRGPKRRAKRWTVVVAVAVLVVICAMEVVLKKKKDKPEAYYDTQLARNAKVVKLPRLGTKNGYPRWGMAGLGRIALDFALILKLQGGRLEAVAAGSLPDSLERAQAFAKRRGALRSYGSYQDLADDDQVDIVYISTTNHLHCELTLLFLRAGKHVLVEKPTATNTEEIMLMIDEAKRQKKLLATNFWNAAFPITQWALDQTASGVLGSLVATRGDMAFQAVYNPNDRFLSPALGGGAMLDMGCYLLQTHLNFVSKLRPDIKQPFEASLRANSTIPLSVLDAHNIGHFSDTGVDIENLISVQADGIFGQFGVSFQRDSPFNFELLFSHGRLEIVAPSNCPEHAYMTIRRDAALQSHTPLPCCGQSDLATRHIDAMLPPFPKNQQQQYPGTMGFAYMIEHVQNCLADPTCLDLPIVPYWIQLATQHLSDLLLSDLQHSKKLTSS